MENKFSFKWIALLASAAGTPWMVHQSTQGRSEQDISSMSSDSANDLWNTAKGSLAQFESYLQSGNGNSSNTANASGDGWSFPSDPRSLNSSNGQWGGQPQVSQAAWGTGANAPMQNAASSQQPAPNGSASNGLQGMPMVQSAMPPAAPVDFREYFRFDATPDWVVQRYPRVSTISASKELDGYRAPLVTGTSLTDLTGTITYYFDRFQKVQRIQFQGLTGDPQPLVYLMTQYYYFTQKPILGGQLYVVAWNANPTGVMEITRANVVFSANQANSFKIFLEINQPNVPGGVSVEGQQILSHHFGGPTER
ncbi:MAG: hypothetical protein JNK90_10070 [Planctomycetaceae bacterium]|nr:hypothetical protein [Planctomycetaceae bacterium]